MKVNWNYIKAILILALVVFLYGFSHQRNSYKKVSEINISFIEGENLFMDYEMVNKLLIQNGETVKNKDKSVIDLHQLEANVLAHPMVEDASVYLTVNGLLNAKIKQRTPIARIVTGSKTYYVDKQAETMPLSPNYSARVLLVSGNVNKNNTKAIHQLATSIRNDEFLVKQLIGVKVLPNNECVLLPRVGNHIIELGEIEHLNEKFKKLKAFYKKAFVDKTIENYTTLNLKYKNQVVCIKK